MIKSLTSLRFIFILFIFLHHCKGYVGGGTMAVSFFFILGGFCMFLGYKDRIFVDSFNYGRYITRRALKFYPLHWICLFTVLLLSTSFLQVPFDWTKVPIFLSNFALLHTWVPLEDYYFSYNSVSWYLADTMFFACLFPLLYRWIMGTDRRGRICIFLMFVLLYVIVAIFVPSDRWHAILYISPYIRVTDFIFGFFLAVFYCNIKDSSKIKCFFKNGSFNFLLIFALIGALVFESFYLGRFQLIAPFYWPLIALLILTATLSDRSKGLFSLLENILFY